MVLASFLLCPNKVWELRVCVTVGFGTQWGRGWEPQEDTAFLAKFSSYCSLRPAEVPFCSETWLRRCHQHGRSLSEDGAVGDLDLPRLLIRSVPRMMGRITGLQEVTYFVYLAPFCGDNFRKCSNWTSVTVRS